MKETIVDKRKKESQILLTAITGSSYTIKIQCDDVNLGSKRGIQRDYGNGLVDVTENKWCQLQQQFTWMTDF